MTKEQFIKAIALIEECDSVTDKLYAVGIDIINSPLFDNFGKMSDMLWQTNFSEEDADLINWWLYERFDFNTGKLQPIYTLDGKDVYVRTPEGLWNILQDVE